MQADQFSTVCSIRCVCQTRDIHSMCREDLLEMMPELNFDGPYLEERETTNFKTIINGIAT